MPTRIAVLGVGRIGRIHGQLIQASPELELAAVADTHPQTAADGGTLLRAPVRSIDEVLADTSIDAVAICSSTDTHVDLIVRAAQAGKAIFCEKPISTDLSRIDEAIAAVERAGVPFMVGFNRRFDPHHGAVQRAVAEGKVGEVHSVHIISRDPQAPPLAYVKVSGGMFVDMTIHDFDMARFVTGSEVVEVYARGSARIDPGIAEVGDIDTAKILLVHACGALTTIDNSRQASYGYDQRVEVFGSKGAVMSHNIPDESATLWQADGSRGSRVQDFFISRYDEAYRREWQAFARYLREGGASPVGLADGRSPIVIAMAAAESLRTGLPVRI